MMKVRSISSPTICHGYNKGTRRYVTKYPQSLICILSLKNDIASLSTFLFHFVVVNLFIDMAHAEYFDGAGISFLVLYLSRY